MLPCRGALSARRGCAAAAGAARRRAGGGAEPVSEPVSESIDSQCGVEFHKAWMKRVRLKEYEPPPVERSDFHKDWMERVHRSVIQNVDPRLAEAVSEMKDETVPALFYLPAEALAEKSRESAVQNHMNMTYWEPRIRKLRQSTGGKGDAHGAPSKWPLTPDMREFPPMLTMWYPGHPQAKTITWRVGAHNSGRLVGRRQHRTGNRGPYDHLTFRHGMEPEKGSAAPRAPWKLPARYKTVPIPMMHMQGPFALSGIRFFSPFGLRMMLCAPGPDA